MTRPTLLTLSLFFAGTALAAPRAEDSERFIVNGQPEDGYPSAVSLVFDFPGFRQAFCSASLITPKMVLTAAHCTVEVVRQFGATVDQLAEVGAIGIGTSVQADIETVKFARIVNHPQYGGQSATGAPEFDVGVIELAEEVEGVDPVWFATEGLDETVGKDVLSVGWGVTSSAAQNSSGIKRSAVLTIAEVDDQFLYSSAAQNQGRTNVCSGDSGGPQYRIKEDGSIEQWAIHSFVFGFGGDPCLGNSGSFRTDAAAQFILNQVEEVHGTTDRCEIYGEYEDRICNTDCAQEDPICVADLDGDGIVTDEEFDSVDRDGDGDLTSEEAERAGKGCDQSGGTGSLALLGLVGLLGLRRRR